LITVKPRHALERDVSSVPQPPFWAATTLSPYRGRAASHIAIDYRQLLAEPGGADHVSVWNGDIEGVKFDASSLLVDATGPLEETYGRGAFLANGATEREIETTILVCPHSSLDGLKNNEHLAVTLSAWPLDEEEILARVVTLSKEGFRWGLAIPILYPITTDLPALTRLADLASTHGALFLTSIPLDLDPAAKQRIATTLSADDESYLTLFASDLEVITVATERHIAALAFERGLSDSLLLPRSEERSNWNASILLSTAGTRMLRMKREVEEGWRLVRSAKTIAELDKPVSRIAAQASLSIIDGLSLRAVEILSEWIQRGHSRRFEEIAAAWRLRRDYGVTE